VVKLGIIRNIVSKKNVDNNKGSDVSHSIEGNTSSK
jgi:hypothetical protein